jgi:hypothetical protein
VVPRAGKELIESFETVIARVKRHDGHVETQANEAHCKPPLVKSADIESAKQYFVTIVQVDTYARKHEDITKYNRRLKWDVHSSNYRK